MPAKTDKQAITARIAGAIKKGLQKGKPGEPSTEMAKMPMKSLEKFMHTKKDKKVKKEEVIENARFFGVRKPSGEIAEKDMVFEFDPLAGVQPLNIDMKDVHTVATDETQAREIAAEAYSKYCNEVQALEEKKGKVGDKLKKTIDHLEKKRKEHVDMAKEDPKSASQHKEHIAKLASQIDDLMSKMERIEKSKKEIEKKEEKKEDLKESSLNIGDNIKVGDKFIKKDKQVLTIKKIDGNNVFLESDKFPGYLWQWPRQIFDEDVKNGELRWQPIDEVENKKKSLDESNFTAELGKTKTGDTTVIVKKDGEVLSFDDQLNLSDKEQDEIKILKAKAVEASRWRSKNK